MSLFTKKKKGKKAALETFDDNLLTDKTPFAVQEAYRMVRTNIMFSVPGDGCKKIIVTSGTQGEAKSTTSINIAISFAQNHAKVLLMDCDLRLPTIASKLGNLKEQGLSNLLAGMCSLDEVIQHTPFDVDIITAGEIPPNPTELLGSDAMGNLLEQLGEKYDYIILDTPPACVVTDAAVLTKFCSGVILVARQNLAQKEQINEAIHKLEFAKARILGFVFTGVENEKYGSYRKKSGYSYEYH